MVSSRVWIIATLYVDQLETWLAVLATIGGGLVGALVAIVAYLAGVAVFGAALGAFVVNDVWRSDVTEPNTWLVLGACLAGALIALGLRRYVIMVGTSFGGSWTALVGGFALAGNSEAIAAASGDVQQVYPLAPASTPDGVRDRMVHPRWNRVVRAVPMGWSERSSTAEEIASAACLTPPSTIS